MSYNRSWKRGTTTRPTTTHTTTTMHSSIDRLPVN
jgi:hypothetical protein